MIQATLTEINKIELQPQTLPPLTDHDVRIKIKFCGICGSDLARFFDGKVHYYPIVLGHEFSGIITDIGKQVKSISVGDKVAGIPLIPCHSCHFCKCGSYSQCDKYKFIGSSINGAFASYVQLKENNVYKIDQSIDYRDGVYFETSCVALHAIRKLGNLTGKDVGILGAGTIGILAAQWATILGAESVTLLGRKEYGNKFDGCKFHYINYASKKSLDNSFDLLVDAAGVSETLDLSLKWVKKQGKIVVIGTPRENIHMDPGIWSLLCRKEVEMIGSWMGYSSPFPGQEWSETALAVKQKKLVLDKLLTYKVYDLENIEKAFFNFKKDKVTGRVLIKI